MTTLVLLSLPAPAVAVGSGLNDIRPKALLSNPKVKMRKKYLFFSWQGDLQK
jgi:hypothetical protein